MEKNENIDFAAKFNLRGIERVLEGEEIIDAISGFIDRTMAGVKQKRATGALVLTPTRVILYHNKMLFKGHSSMEFPLQRINSVDFNSGMIYADIKIHAGSDILIMDKASKVYGERFIKNLKTLISNLNNPTSTTPNSQFSQSPQVSDAPHISQAPQIDIADQLQKLANLKAQGILTEEEFTTQKKKLLGLL
ncbi:MAG TPA: PH domain-containing protein [Methanosarcina sp.]|jgi:hypothetical protein